MADMLQSGLAWLSAQLQANAATTITYRRGSQSVRIQATMGAQLLKVTDLAGNAMVERPDADFIFPAANLDFGAGPVAPAEGDLVEKTYGSITRQFKVMPVGGSEPAWRYCDPYQINVRVHTKFVGNV